MVASPMLDGTTIKQGEVCRSRIERISGSHVAANATMSRGVNNALTSLNATNKLWSG